MNFKFFKQCNCFRVDLVNHHYTRHFLASFIDFYAYKILVTNDFDVTQTVEYQQTILYKKSFTYDYKFTSSWLKLHLGDFNVLYLMVA